MPVAALRHMPGMCFVGIIWSYVSLLSCTISILQLFEFQNSMFHWLILMLTKIWFRWRLYNTLLGEYAVTLICAMLQVTHVDHEDSLYKPKTAPLLRLPHALGIPCGKGWTQAPASADSVRWFHVPRVIILKSCSFNLVLQLILVIGGALMVYYLSIFLQILRFFKNWIIIPKKIIFQPYYFNDASYFYIIISNIIILYII